MPSSAFGRDEFTTRHRAVISAVWEIPVGRGRRYMSDAPAVANQFLGGWQLYWIAYLESGWYFSPTFSGSDPSNTNTSGGRPDRVCNGNLPSGDRSISRWFDPSCFAVPPSGRFGNSGSDVLEGPGYHMHHISFAKNFDLTERLKFTFTMSAANAFNHPNFARPSANISTPGSVGVVERPARGRGGPPHRISRPLRLLNRFKVARGRLALRVGRQSRNRGAPGRASAPREPLPQYVDIRLLSAAARAGRRECTVSGDRS